jgi:DNA-directed RNA polymerase subunit RPC12/RpoP
MAWVVTEGVHNGGQQPHAPREAPAVTTAYPHHEDQQPAYRCTHCPRLLHADELARYACRVCEDRATEQAQAFPDLYQQLERVLRPGATPSAGGRVTASRSAPLPVALQPLSLRGPGGIVSMLLGIEQRWRIQLDFERIPFRGNYEQTLPKTVLFLVNNLPWACDKYAEVPDDLDLIARLYFQAKNAVTGNQPRIIRVPCRYVHDDGNECGSELRIDINKNIARCQNCGAHWGREEWVNLYEATQAQAA